MVAINQDQADALLAVLRRTPVWRKHPNLEIAFKQCNFKRFIANDDMGGKIDTMQAAERLGGVCALSQSRPPPGLIADIIEVLDADHTYLLMTDTAELREEVFERVDIALSARRVGKGPVLADIGPRDTAHRTLASAVIDP